eukprot:scaffold156067_cov31-Attheya_sp.AAC.1
MRTIPRDDSSKIPFPMWSKEIGAEGSSLELPMGAVAAISASSGPIFNFDGDCIDRRASSINSTSSSSTGVYKPGDERFESICSPRNLSFSCPAMLVKYTVKISLDFFMLRSSLTVTPAGRSSTPIDG